MPVVRCPIHKVPYNDENPRGCPACWQEKVGDDPAGLMRELARASRAIPRVEILPTPDEDDLPPMQRLPTGAWPGPVTQPPRVPQPEPTSWERVQRFLRAHLAAAVTATVALVVVSLLWIISRPTFEESLIPPPAVGEALPFPVQPNTPILGAFALLGPRTPGVHPDSPSLARYDFGSGTTVDVFNGIVYAVTLESPARSWQGNRVGTDERRARGVLSLLGPMTEDEGTAAAPFPFGGYLTYRRMADLPRRRLSAAVRPPNGCYDVQVDLAPQVIGTATRGDENFVAVARRGGEISWVTHRVRVVSRSMRGPYAGAPACE